MPSLLSSAHRLILLLLLTVFVVVKAQVVTTVAGNPYRLAGEGGGVGTNAFFNYPTGITMNYSLGYLYVADKMNNAIRAISISTSLVSNHAGGGLTGYVTGVQDATGTRALFSQPTGITMGLSGNVYVTELGYGKVRGIALDRSVHTFVGGGADGKTEGYTNDLGTAALFSNPRGIAVSYATGRLFVADSSNHVIREVSLIGAVTELAGTYGTPGPADGIAALAQFNVPVDVVISLDGTILYVADMDNHKIRMITISGLVTTFVGGGLNGKTSGSTNGVGTAALFYAPTGVAKSSSVSTIYVTDYSNHMIRVISTGGVVTTLAGGGTSGKEMGNFDAIGTTALFNGPWGLVVDPFENVYFADSMNNVIRKIAPSSLSPSSSETSSPTPTPTPTPTSTNAATMIVSSVSATQGTVAIETASLSPTPQVDRGKIFPTPSAGALDEALAITPTGSGGGLRSGTIASIFVAVIIFFLVLWVVLKTALMHFKRRPTEISSIKNETDIIGVPFNYVGGHEIHETKRPDIPVVIYENPLSAVSAAPLPVDTPSRALCAPTNLVGESSS